MAVDVCTCGHLDIPTHPDGGPCRMYGCDCDRFVSEDEATIEEAA